MTDITKNKELLKINIIWMLVIYVVLCFLAFHFSTVLGIVAVSISAASYIFYVIVGIKLKRAMKNKNEASIGNY